MRKYGLMGVLKKIACFFANRFLLFSYPAVHFLSYPRVAARRRKNEPLLRRFMQGKKVLILGSGPSTADIDLIPDDVLVFTCNRGLKFFAGKPTTRPLDFYLCTAGKIQRMPVIALLLQKLKTRFLVIDDLRYTRRQLTGVFEHLIQDDGKHGHYLKNLIHPQRLRYIRGSSFHPWTSTGIRLLQYALYHEAAEIYLAGIDFGNNGYFWGGNEDKWLHDEIDENFLRIVSKKYKNVYSI